MKSCLSCQFSQKYDFSANGENMVDKLTLQIPGISHLAIELVVWQSWHEEVCNLLHVWNKKHRPLLDIAILDGLHVA